MKIAVITGASSGIGVDFAKEILTQRPEIEKIFVIARRKERLLALKEELGDKIYPLPLDITNPEAVKLYEKELKDNNADVRLLINNAGFGKHGGFDKIPCEENVGMVRLNCEALTVVSSVTLPFMNKGAEIINSCSIASFAPNTNMAVYCSTKAYVMSLSRCMRSELKRRGINVLAMCPGPMDTEFLSVANIEKGTSRTFDTLPRVNPKVMAKKCLKASGKKKSVYTNLLFYKFYRFVAKILPHSLVMKMSAT